jgi:integrative and conjugative element protein (TIGR02256 family)
MKLVYRVTPRQRLIIVEHALKQMQAFAQHSARAHEAGGVLLGRYLLDTRDVVVDEVSTPQCSDRRSRYGFFRSSKHELLARQRWLEEKSTSAYLGLWHTHPYEGDRLFFPIIGTHCIRIWTLSRRGTYRELKLESKNAQI